jgi:dynamin 1-like protein
MDRGTNAMEVLDGSVIPLRLGYVAVINRAQEDIDKNKRIDQQWKAEKEYFENHPAYRTIADRCGTPYLTKTLNRILVAHIRTCLPGSSFLYLLFSDSLRNCRQDCYFLAREEGRNSVDC